MSSDSPQLPLPATPQPATAVANAPKLNSCHDCAALIMISDLSDERLTDPEKVAVSQGRAVYKCSRRPKVEMMRGWPWRASRCQEFGTEVAPEKPLVRVQYVDREVIRVKYKHDIGALAIAVALGMILGAIITRALTA
jgi:hypothetical protein